ncbi:MAG: hypothetical protein HY016_05330 [Nitrosomonadales bacterium]|nr:hypothetical protein [Nitrosomonadales bacterium]
MFSYSNWSVLTVNFLVVLYLALGGVTLSAVLHLVGARWRYEVRFLASSLFALFPLAFVLLVILLVNGETTFPWLKATGEHAHHHIPAWHNYTFLVTREILGMLAVMAIHWVFIKRQAVSERSEEDAARFHNIACWVPYAYVLYGTMVAWDFEMTMLPSWHSAIYGMQHFVSNFGMFLAFLVIWIYALNSRNKLVRPVETYVYNYFAQMMFAFTLLWIYTFFAQYLTIWYGNLPAETVRVMAMQNGDYTFIWWSMIVLKFVIPFTMLAFPVTRHSVQATTAVATSIIIGTLFERYVWIGGVKDGVGTYPILAAIVVGGVVATIGFFLVRMRLQSTQLVKG